MTPEQTQNEFNALIAELQAGNVANLAKINTVITDETANISAGSLALLNAVKASFTAFAAAKYATADAWHLHRYNG